MNDTKTALRVTIMRVVFVLAFAFLGLRLWGLQIGRSEKYSLLADKNRFRLVSVDAPRGVIYDRAGRILVRNVPSFSISVVPASLPQDEKELASLCERLAALLGLPASSREQRPAWFAETALAASETAYADQPPLGVKELVQQIKDQVKEGKLSRYSPVPLVSNVSKDTAFIAEEERLHLPGVVVEIKPQREYLHGSLTSHWLGYVGPIPEKVAPTYLNQRDSDYEPTDQVGLTGVELTFERALRGRKGKNHVEVDAFEREVRTLAVEPTKAGNSLILTMDAELQRVAEQALRERMGKVKSSSGSVIAMNPQTGEILAMVSLPSYDNNLFSGGISMEDYRRLVNDPLSPLLNHAIGGEYPPGSSFKVIPACAGLEEKVINDKTEFTCQGTLWLPSELMPDDPSKAQPFYCWVKTGHGRMNLMSGLAYSCDIYFYHVGGGFKNFTGLGLERLAYYARQFGFGEPTGIDLPGEASGLVPTERWKRENWDTNWVTGDTYNVSIGQGYILATPLQLLNAIAAVANGGTLYRPQVVRRIVDSQGNIVKDFQPQAIRRLPVSRENIELVRKGMRAAVSWGTAILLELDLPGIRAAGKTGTAEYPGERDKEGHLPTHAWFAAFAPFENPEIALVVFIAGGGQGALEAVPVASKILRHYFQVPEPTPTPKPK